MDALPEVLSINFPSLLEPKIQEPLGGILISPQASPISTPDDHLYCVLCKKKFSVKQSFQAHEKTSKHINNLNKARQSLSPTKSDVIQSTPGYINEQELDQLNRQIAMNEAVVQTKPNQAFKGIYLTAQSLLDHNYIQAGATALHKLLYYIEKTIPVNDPNRSKPFMFSLPIGRLLLYLKSSMILSRLFQIGFSPSSHEKSKEYATRALCCFFENHKWKEYDKLCQSLPYNLSSKELLTSYQQIVNKIPNNFQSKDKYQEGDPHDIYSIVFLLLLEVGGLFSLFKISQRSLSFFILANSLAKYEKQMEDYQLSLEKVIIIKDYLSFRSYPKFFLIKKLKNSFTFFQMNIEVLQSMAGPIAYVERLELFEETKLSCWLIEVMIISLVSMDTVMLASLVKKKEYYNDILFHNNDPVFHFVPIFWDIISFTLNEDTLAFLTLHHLPLWKQLVLTFPFMDCVCMLVASYFCK